MDILEKMLKLLNDKKGADLLLTAEHVPQIRVQEALEDTTFPALSGKDIERIAMKLLDDEQKQKLQLHKDVDIGFGISHLSRFRTNIYYQRGSLSMAIRRIPFEVPGFDELGLPEITKDFALRPAGLFLVSGPVGCGKSTTLAAMIEYINKKKAAHVVCIEDPIEYLHSNKKCVIDQREVGKDTQSFNQALKGVFRQSPDIIMVGEMRDLESIRHVLTLAETGHLILTTLHTQDTTHAINRIIDVFPAGQQEQVRIQLSMVLVGVMVQQLIPKKDGSGRVLACEIMNVNTAIRNLIKEKQPQQIYSVLQTSKAEGMVTMNDSLERLYTHGIISGEYALGRSIRPKELLKRVKIEDEIAREIIQE